MVNRITHIINPVAADKDSRFYFTQRVTFRTMQIARNFASNNVDVDFLSVQYPEDRGILPRGFVPAPDLERSILDLGVFQKPRKLPLLQDILARAYEYAESEYFVYTNIDIGLLPNFYLSVQNIIDAGFDAFTINRRTISDHYSTIDQIPQMYAEVGDPHRGWDCFVFSRTAFAKYQLGDVCIGIPRADLVLLGNLIAHAKNFKEFRDLHLTFHLGNDRSWWHKDFDDYETHNTSEAVRVLTEIETRYGSFGPDTPPGTFLYFSRNRLRSFLYDILLRYVHLPAKFGRPLRNLMRLLRPRR